MSQKVRPMHSSKYVNMPMSCTKMQLQSRGGKLLKMGSITKGSTSKNPRILCTYDLNIDYWWHGKYSRKMTSFNYFFLLSIFCKTGKNYSKTLFTKLNHIWSCLKGNSYYLGKHNRSENYSRPSLQKLDHMYMSNRKLTCIWASIIQAINIYKHLYVREAFQQACGM